MSRYGDMNLSIFDGQDPGGVLWQPRLEYWYAVNHARGTLPEPVAGDDIRRVYDYCHASVRYFGHGLRMRYRTVEVSQEQDGKSVHRNWKTPLGTLSDTLRYDEWNLSRHLVDYQVKSVDTCVFWNTCGWMRSGTGMRRPIGPRWRALARMAHHSSFFSARRCRT